ncbi:hypothetical protein JXL83_09455 [candidate division WOR-3 bacterium]|nr:hypothetical protein [candidate division WOR-3 bacterium]
MQKTRLYSLLVLFLLSGCIKYSTLQSPKTLERGDYSVGIAGSKFIFSDSGEARFGSGSIDVFARAGLKHNLDFGCKATIYEGGAFNLFSDVKYRFFETPVMISGDVGALVSFRTNGLYLMALAGNDNIYTGIKAMFVHEQPNSTQPMPAEDTAYIPKNPLGLVLGGGISSFINIKIVPELNVYFSEGYEPMYLFSCGIRLDI